MIIINNASELLSEKMMANVTLNEVYVKENNLKIIGGHNRIFFIELESNRLFEFDCNHDGRGLQLIMADLFKENDLDIALYFLLHTYHKTIDNQQDGYYAITHHPQYTQFINTEDFKFQIGQYRPDQPLFSPFKKEKKQNLNTRINVTKLIRAILAGQIERVVCNGIYTDNWYYDEHLHNRKGEWDLYDFADRLTDLSSYYYITRKGTNVLSVYYSVGEHSESFTVYLKES